MFLNYLKNDPGILSVYCLISNRRTRPQNVYSENSREYYQEHGNEHALRKMLRDASCVFFLDISYMFILWNKMNLFLCRDVCMYSWNIACPSSPTCSESLHKTKDANSFYVIK